MEPRTPERKRRSPIIPINTTPPPSTTSPYYPAQDLIFNDDDDRLPSTVPSPTHHINNEIDVASVSSQELEEIDYSLSQPMPLPYQLLKPPKLRHSQQHPTDLQIDIPEAPEWTAKLRQEQEYFVPNADDFNDHLDYQSDNQSIKSDQATISDESILNTEMSSEKLKPNKPKKSFFNFFKKKTNEDLPVSTDELGNTYDLEEENLLKKQMGVIDNDMAFTRLDPETIQRHSQMFDATGLYSGIKLKRGTTSLIEELEIRKAGRKVQYQVFSREAAENERQRREETVLHPADLVNNQKVTLMQMQQMADANYKSRVEWHTNEINVNYQDKHLNETLAERRMRLLRERGEQGEQGGREETLRERRERLKTTSVASSF